MCQSNYFVFEFLLFFVDKDFFMIELFNGDCLQILKSIPDKSVDLVLTDPPYGTTVNKWDAVVPLEKMWNELKRVIKKNGAVVLFSQNPFSSVLVSSNLIQYKYDWVWVKEAGTGFLNAKKYPLKDNELINVFCDGVHPYFPQMEKGKAYTQKKGGATSNYNKDSRNEIVTTNDGFRYPKTTLHFNREKEKFHPTQKPVALLEYLIKTYTQENETVLDFTMGSGSTGVAAKNLNRNFIGIEKDENYFKIACDRIGYTPENEYGF